MRRDIAYCCDGERSIQAQISAVAIHLWVKKVEIVQDTLDWREMDAQ